MSHSIHSTETHRVPDLPEPIRLQDYAVGIFKQAYTKSALKKAIKKRYVTINGVLASTARYLSGGETITLTIPNEFGAAMVPDLPLEVIYEDQYMAVICKPAGIVVSGNKHKTIANALPQNLEPGKDAALPQPVHRLDYATTGTLLVGKTHKSIRALNKLFAENRIVKEYHAVTIGTMNKEGIIDSPVDGKKAETHYQVLASVPSKRFGSLNLVRLHPNTGRTHQLRIHLSGTGHPILGDQTYGIEGLVLKGKGLYLHASSLEFKHPFTGEHFLVHAQLPPKFRRIFQLKSG